MLEVEAAAWAAIAAGRGRGIVATCLYRASRTAEGRLMYWANARGWGWSEAK